ncbi:MAG: aldolase/citrate lyase family protein [Eubacteriales bacterium]|nr:aldolase/citrate lyase family protein [Eubacteriales bacterium]
MPLKLMFFTNSPRFAKAAEACRIDFVVIDLEIIGKLERQGHKDTRISHHVLSDITPVRQVLRHTPLMVRINPVHEQTAHEIESALQQGADILMLPFFKTLAEVQTFLTLVRGRAKAYLLLETKEAEAILDDILDLPGIDAIHIGINDLALSKGYSFLFQTLLDDSFAAMCAKIRSRGLPFGFGGIAQLGQGLVPAENIITEHIRLGSTMAIMARSFITLEEDCPLEEIVAALKAALDPVREYESYLTQQEPEFFQQNRTQLHALIREIINA